MKKKKLPIQNLTMLKNIEHPSPPSKRRVTQSTHILPSLKKVRHSLQGGKIKDYLSV